MSYVKPSIPKGTRDFVPEEFARRKYIFNTIENEFKKYGYKPLETPSMEFLSTLTGKYGDEGDKLIFKILNSGDYLSEVSDEELTNKDLKSLTSRICEKALRYDLTVPFARFVVQHYNELTFPFKRYQMQPVWRADRPQKGRYREFYQCDIDVIGSTSLLNEAELIKISDGIFQKLHINVTIKLNNRKILNGIAEVLGENEKFTDITVALDKLDKVGWEIVHSELIAKGIKPCAVEKIALLVKMSESPTALTEIAEFVKDSEIGRQGIEELRTVIELTSKMNVKSQICFDVLLARGLNYYTGTIFEIAAKDVQMGSISGGGRYDDLTGIFGLDNMSGVGISYGADRIYDVMQMLGVFPESLNCFTQVLFLNFGDREVQYILFLAEALRKKGISTEIFPDNAKMKKQMSYADKNKIPFVIIAGENEIQNNVFTLKNMTTGTQQELSFEAVLNIFN
ncbi:MAG: histidine--tRNA ligase [Bacteroidales bacterium]|nr:histidine--tRNA ligase [Bacteroidales bacterium]